MRACTEAEVGSGPCASPAFSIRHRSPALSRGRGLCSRIGGWERRDSFLQVLLKCREQQQLVMSW